MLVDEMNLVLEGMSLGIARCIPVMVSCWPVLG